MWGCLIATAIIFPLVFGWIHFETVPDDLDFVSAVRLRLPTVAFPIDSLLGFFMLSTVWCSHRSW